MKTNHNRIFEFKTARLGPRHSRVGMPGRSRRNRKSATTDSTAPVVEITEPQIAVVEPEQTALPRGDTFQLYLREIGRVTIPFSHTPFVTLLLKSYASRR